MSAEFIFLLCFVAFLLAVDPLARAVKRWRRKRDRKRADRFYRNRDSTNP